MARIRVAWRWLVGALLKIQQPPVTVLTILLMVLAYLDCTKFDRLLHPQNSLGWRAFLCVFYHKSGLHLFLDILWTLNMGARFEKLHGSWCFLGTMTLMIFLSQGFTLLVNLPYVFLRKQHPHIMMPPFQLSNCTLGFSGVLFALYFLLVSQYHFRGDGLHNLSHHHGLSIEGLFLLASLQTLILPDSHFFNNLSGILAGFVYLNSPHILKFCMMCLMVVHMVRPVFNGIYKVFINLCIKTKEYYHIVQYPRHRRDSNPNNGENDHNGTLQEEEEDGDLDLTLQWECKTCLKRNGVFLSSCEFCTHSRNDAS